jgi:hypothetical protein
MDEFSILQVLCSESLFSCFQWDSSTRCVVTCVLRVCGGARQREFANLPRGLASFGFSE